MQSEYLLITVVVLSCFLCPISASVASSISGMETLLDTEKQMLMIFDDYIKAKEVKIDAIKK